LTNDEIIEMMIKKFFFFYLTVSTIFWGWCGGINWVKKRIEYISEFFTFIENISGGKENSEKLSIKKGKNEDDDKIMWKKLVKVSLSEESVHILKFYDGNLIQ
jgi:hypothetical protein